MRSRWSLPTGHCERVRRGGNRAFSFGNIEVRHDLDADEDGGNPKMAAPIAIGGGESITVSRECFLIQARAQIV
jgi:hypothetical protein